MRIGCLWVVWLIQPVFLEHLLARSRHAAAYLEWAKVRALQDGRRVRGPVSASGHINGGSGMERRGAGVGVGVYPGPGDSTWRCGVLWEMRLKPWVQSRAVLWEWPCPRARGCLPPPAPLSLQITETTRWKWAGKNEQSPSPVKTVPNPMSSQRVPQSARLGHDRTGRRFC